MSVQTPPPVDPAANIDLTGGEETPAQTVGRVIGGLLLLIICSVLALGFLAVYLAGDFIPGMADIRELGGDWLLYLAIFAFVGAVVGFGMVRSNRKRRAAEAAEAKAVMDQVKAAQAAAAAAPPASAPPASDSGLGPTIT
jgi:hypothetical protein